jgi:putative transposase
LLTFLRTANSALLDLYDQQLDTDFYPPGDGTSHPGRIGLPPGAAQFKNLRFVILENHLHLIAQSPDLPAEIGSFKSWTAKRLLDVLKEQRAERILKQLAFYKKAHKHDRDYQVWEEGSHPEQIQSHAMMLQKIEYIHQNPVKRGYVDNPVHWRNSSARIYAGEIGVLNIDREW